MSAASSAFHLYLDHDNRYVHDIMNANACGPACADWQPLSRKGMRM